MPQYCAGSVGDGADCIFSKVHPGTRAQCLRGSGRCLFCDPTAMRQACLTGAPRRAVLQGLRAFAAAPDVLQRALALVPDEYHAYFKKELSAGAVCRGANGEACVFGLGDRAASVYRREPLCMFCDLPRLAGLCAAPGRRSIAVRGLRRMSDAACAKALAERIPEAFRAEFARMVTVRKRPAAAAVAAPAAAAGAAAAPVGALRRRPAAAAGLALPAPSALWAAALAQRGSSMAPAGVEARKRYREHVLNDRARARRHAGFPRQRARRGADVGNDTGLPAAKRSRLATDFERWCLYNVSALDSGRASNAPCTGRASLLARGCRALRSLPGVSVAYLPRMGSMARLQQ
jgi:hypothetical protein